jgi:H/ACA ribonucleoprotein complex subunit 3
MKIRKCSNCKNYTFKEICPKCGEKTSRPLPPSFSPQDKYGKYRRKFIKEMK